MDRWKEIVGGSDSKKKESPGDLGSTATSAGLDSRMGSSNGIVGWLELLLGLVEIIRWLLR